MLINITFVTYEYRFYKCIKYYVCTYSLWIIYYVTTLNIDSEIVNLNKIFLKIFLCINI